MSDRNSLIPRPRAELAKALAIPTLRDIVKKVVPRAVRIERVRWKRYPSWILEHGQMATQRREPATAFPHIIAARHSPLRRPGIEVDEPLQRGKETNIARVVAALHGTVIDPQQLLSYHHLVGRPTLRRGFALGPELHDLKMASGVGGGACQVTNMLYQLALLSGLTIVERHRHSRDLYPDSGRTVPFGCGATVFYNRADLRFRNPLNHPVFIDLQLREGTLVGAIRARHLVDFHVEVFDKHHRFFFEAGRWVRENELWRRILDGEGRAIDTHKLDSNRALTLYVPREEDLAAPSVVMRSDGRSSGPQPQARKKAGSMG